MIDTGLFYAIDYQGNKVILTKKLGFQPGQNVFEGLLIRKDNEIKIHVLPRVVEIIHEKYKVLK